MTQLRKPVVLWTYINDTSNKYTAPVDQSSMTASISTPASRGKEATPIAARAG